MVVAHPAILPAPFHYCNLEMVRSITLQHGLLYDAMVEVTSEMKADLNWWDTSLSPHNRIAMEILQ